MMFSRQSPSLIGIDIQPSALRLVQLRRTHQTYDVERVDSIDLPSAVFMEGKIHQWDVIVSALTDWVQRSKVAGMAAVIVLPANRVRMKSITLPAGLLKTAIEAEIYAILQRDFPGLNDALYMDYVFKEAGNPDEEEIIFVAARQETVMEYVQCVNRSGLQTKIVDVDVYAIQRALGLCSFHENRISEADMLVWETDDLVQIVVFDNQAILFYQSWQKRSGHKAASQWMQFIHRYDVAQFGKPIRQLHYAGASTQFAEDCISSNAYWKNKITSVQAFTTLTCSDAVKEHLMADSGWAYLAACGASMREVPKWSTLI